LSILQYLPFAAFHAGRSAGDYLVILFCLGAMLVVSAGCGDPTGITPAPDPTRFTAPIVGEPMQDVFYGAYVDHGSHAAVKDYACGIKAYPGHRGVDILLRNFLEQDAGVPVVAAASGIVAVVDDGWPDRNTSWESGGAFGNHVVIAHPDGYSSVYGHLRRGSIAVRRGEAVERGALLGLVGSSGRSNWPHLHFEVWRSGVAVEPFAGDCATSAGLWADQLPYQDAFMVTDAGLIEYRQVTLAEMLERPPTIEVFPLTAEAFRFWMQVANQREAMLRFEIRGPGGDLVHEIHHQAGSTFSMRYLVVGVPVAGVLEEPGSWEIRVFQSEEQIWSQPFTLAEVPTADPPAAASPPAGGRGVAGLGVEVLDQVPHGAF
jgi:hypothetical protein